MLLFLFFFLFVGFSIILVINKFYQFKMDINMPEPRIGMQIRKLLFENIQNIYEKIKKNIFHIKKREPLTIKKTIHIYTKKTHIRKNKLRQSYELPLKMMIKQTTTTTKLETIF